MAKNREIKEVLYEEKRKEHAAQRRAKQKSMPANGQGKATVEIKTQQNIGEIQKAIEEDNQKLNEAIAEKIDSDYPLLSQSYKDKTKYCLCPQCLKIYILDYPIRCSSCLPECPKCDKVMHTYNSRQSVEETQEYIKSKMGRGV